MILLWAVAGFFQTFFIPGWMLLSWKGTRITLFSTIFFGVILSLLFNYSLTLALCLAGINSPLVWRTLLFVELGMIYLFFDRQSRNELEVDCKFSFFEFFFLLAAGLFVLYKGTRWIKGWGTILNSWDGVVSWNRWASDWFQSRLPTMTWEYPQLLPVVYSIQYEFVGRDDLTFFPKIAANFFYLWAASAFLLLALVSRSLRIVAAFGAILFLILIDKFNVFMSGIADAPAGALAALPLLFGMLIRFAVLPSFQREIEWMMGIGIAMSALMKLPAGLVLIPCFGLVFWGQHRRDRWLTAARLLMPSVLLVGGWYVYKLMQISNGQDTSISSELNWANHLPLMDRLRIAPLKVFKVLFQGFSYGQIFTPIAALLILGVLAIRSHRFLVWMLIYAVLIFVIWALGASYDVRNLTPMVPAFCIFAGFAAAEFFKRLPFKSVFTLIVGPSRGSRATVTALLLCVGLGTLSAQWSIPDSRLEEMQIEQALRLESPGLNKALIDYIKDHPGMGRIATHYQIARGIPVLREHYEEWRCHLSWRPPPPTVGYYLETPYCSSDFRKGIRDLVSQGKWRSVLRFEDFEMYQIQATGF
jgi:hypothetical protein